MLTGIWSMKGGSGTTVTTCAIARLHPRALIIDTCGDVPAVLGLADSDTPGARDWLARSDERGDTTARVDESADGLLLTVTLERTRRAPWSPLSLLGATSLSATATAAIEPVRGP